MGWMILSLIVLGLTLVVPNPITPFLAFALFMIGVKQSPGKM